MSTERVKYLTTSQFGARLQPPVDKVTVGRWISTGLLPEAVNKSLSTRPYFMIPETALERIESQRRAITAGQQS